MNTNHARLFSILSSCIFACQIAIDRARQEYEPALVRIDEAHPVDIILNPGQVIRRGERHPHVRLIQGMLAVLSEAYDSIGMPSFSGIIDAPTSSSLSDFQYLSALPMTGELDKHTWKHLALQYPLAGNLLISLDR